MYALASPTPTPTEPLEERPNFIGYYIGPTSIQTLTAGDNWVTSGNYAGDCGTKTGATCAFATECNGNTIMYDDGTEGQCGDGASCITFTIFQTSPHGFPSASNLGCRIAWSADTVYREYPASTSATTTTSSTLTTATSTSATPEQTAISPSPVPPPAQSSTTTNNYWIAGAVAGPVVGIALIVLAVWLCIRHRRKKAAMHNNNGHRNPTPPSYEATMEDQSKVQYYGYENRPAEMTGSMGRWSRYGPRPVEMHSEAPIYELPST